MLSLLGRDPDTFHTFRNFYFYGNRLPPMDVEGVKARVRFCVRGIPKGDNYGESIDLEATHKAPIARLGTAYGARTARRCM